MLVTPRDNVVHEITLCNAVNEVAKNPKELMFLAQALDSLSTGFYNDNYLKSIISYDQMMHQFDYADAYVFMHCHAAIFSGEIAVQKIAINATPLADAMIDANNKLLQDKLHPAFNANFKGGNWDADGNFWWNDDIEMCLNFGTDSKVVRKDILVESNNIPLEVGTVGRGKMLQYLHPKNGSGVARWCYGDEFITVYLPVARIKNLRYL